MKKFGALVLCLSVMFLSAELKADYGSAFKSSFTILWGSIKLDHTYFCLNGTSDCFSIVGWGIPSSSTGGARLWGTYGWNTSSERCASRARASNNLLSPCYILYGIEGVCHTQTNRGLKSFGKVMNPSTILGGWASQLAYGQYGNNIIKWGACLTTSNIGCGRWFWER